MMLKYITRNGEIASTTLSVTPRNDDLPNNKKPRLKRDGAF